MSAGLKVPGPRMGRGHTLASDLECLSAPKFVDIKCNGALSTIK